MEYTIVFLDNPTIQEFIYEVNEMIKKGWKPLGGVVIDVPGVEYLQAMIRDNPTPPPAG